MATAMNAIPNISHFSIFRESLSPRREIERQDLMHLLLRLDEFIKFTDVTLGNDPPDFVFHHQNGRIGVELTDLNPKIFEDGGHRKRAEYKTFEVEAAQTFSTDKSFPWDKVTMRESLKALKAQLETKHKKAQPWFADFTERWLLLNVTGGHPIAVILNDKYQPAMHGIENEVADYFAKVTHDVYSICKETGPFDQIILFRKSDTFAEMLLFSRDCLNPYKLPVPSDEILNRGAKVSDSLLDREITLKTNIKKKLHQFLDLRE